MCEWQTKRSSGPLGHLVSTALVTPCVEVSEAENVSNLVLSSLDDCLGSMKGNCCETRRGSLREPHAILCQGASSTEEVQTAKETDLSSDLSLLLGHHGLGQWMLEWSSGLAGMEAIPDVSQQTLLPA